MPGRPGSVVWSTTSWLPTARRRWASGQLDHDVLGIGRARRQPVVPGPQVLERWALDVECMPAMDEAADRDVAHGKMLARDIAAGGAGGLRPAEPPAAPPRGPLI